MKVYLLTRQTRKDQDRDGVYGTFSTFQKAVEALRKELDYDKSGWVDRYKKYDSDINKGCIYTEEDSWEIIEEEIE